LTRGTRSGWIAGSYNPEAVALACPPIVPKYYLDLDPGETEVAFVWSSGYRVIAGIDREPGRTVNDCDADLLPIPKGCTKHFVSAEIAV
jgi:hypothetical protein